MGSPQTIPFAYRLLLFFYRIVVTRTLVALIVFHTLIATEKTNARLLKRRNEMNCNVPTSCWIKLIGMITGATHTQKEGEESPF